MSSPNEGTAGQSSLQATAGLSQPSLNAPQATESASSRSDRQTRNEGSAFAAGGSGPSLPPVSLPSGGGAIRGMGENISMNAVQGTASISIPLDLSPCRRGTEPKMSLTYDSGGGQSIWGMGWSLGGIIDVTRQTRLGVPKYYDEKQEDTFVISGAEDLVPVYLKDGSGDFVLAPKSTPGKEIYILDETSVSGFMVRQYRPRIEGLYSRVERWTDQLDPENIFWRLISPNNEMTILGRDEKSRITSPTGDGKHIFSWLCCEWYDCYGNARMYEYKGENGEGVDLGQANERNRTEEVRNTQRYLKRIKYGNHTPIRDRSLASPAAAKLAPQNWKFEVVFDYGEHEMTDPRSQETQGNVWKCRQDPFSSFKSCFEVRTYRLCQRVLMFHHFPAELQRDDYLVKALELEYRQSPAMTYLKSAQQVGFVLRNASDPLESALDLGSPYFIKRLPAIEFDYTELPSEEMMQNLTLQEFDKDAGLENVPGGVHGNYQWLDLLCEGMNGIFFTNAENEWYYKRNLSAANTSITLEKGEGSLLAEPTITRKPKFGPLERVAIRPSLRDPNNNPQFLDIEGDGSLDLVIMDHITPGFYHNAGFPSSTGLTENAWKPFQPFSSWPTIDLKDPCLRFLDITGDGKADILIARDDVFVWHESLGRNGYAASKIVTLALDEEKAPRILFSDPTESIHIADFSGDGLVDIVRIRNGELCYWPNKGYGRFGAMVIMDNAPVFESMDSFSFQRLLLADIDGSGTTDLVYLHETGAKIYYNLAGNSWSMPLRIASLVPMFDSFTSITAVDLLGSGTACLVWSTSHPHQNPGRSMRYVDLTSGQKPHLLKRVITNMGSETIFQYRPSTAFYLDDLSEGRPWATRLPYPQHCVEKFITYDHVSRSSLSRRYCYHHGYYDGFEKEFRGFGMVEQWDTEQFNSRNGSSISANQSKDVYMPPTHTKSWFHTGAFEDHEKLSRIYARDYFGAPDPTSPGYKVEFENYFARQIRDSMPEDISSWSNDDLREASRALKGSPLRIEIYADDGSNRSEIPYQITDNGNSVRILQSRGGTNSYGVFQTYLRETVKYHLERNPEDPRIEHALSLSIDEFGNVLDSAVAAYGRKPSNIQETDLDDSDKSIQQRPNVTFSRIEFTNPVLKTDDYLTPQSFRSRKWEVTNMVPTHESSELFTTASFSSIDDMKEIQFDERPDPLLLNRRLIEHIETRWRRNDLNGILPLGRLESLSLPGITNRLCIFPSMLSKFQRDGENLLPDNTDVLRAGGYIDLYGNGNWWIPSSQTFYDHDTGIDSAGELEQAHASFFTPRREQDEFGNSTIMTSDTYDLTYVRIEDPMGNTTAGEIDYRTLQLTMVTDANGNRKNCIRDALGIVVGLAVMGREDESLGDTLDNFRANLSPKEIEAYFRNPLGTSKILLSGATSRFVYDLDAFQNKGLDFPVSTSQIVRYSHLHETLPNISEMVIQEAQTHLSITYLDGYRREIQINSQAESHSATPDAVRWRGSGWTVFNNKGLPVRQFEPVFNNTHEFIFDRREGHSSILLYDPVNRPIAKIYPNTTWEKNIIGAWTTRKWDQNDTVKLNIADDDDVGPIVKNISRDFIGTTWYQARELGQNGPQQQLAASKTAGHANTPTKSYLDPVGREFVVVRDNADGGKVTSLIEFDITGNILKTRDGLNRVVTSNEYSMCTGALVSQCADSGSRWELMDIHGQPIRLWDSRGHRMRIEYDSLRRQTHTYSQRDGKEFLVHKDIYGETQPNSRLNNLRGHIYQECDQAGTVTHAKWDFKGNELLTQRQFAKDYKTVLDWTDSSLVHLEAEVHLTKRTYDALDRVLTLTSPDASVVTNNYNDAGFLSSVSTKLKGSENNTSFVVESEFDAYGRLIVQVAGNNTVTTNSFDPLTQLLANRTVVLKKASSQSILQNLSYTYDPIGNVVYIRNDVDQNTFFRNGAVEPHLEYTYDALYRLTEARGREHIGQTKGSPTGPTVPNNPGDGVAAGDGTAMVRYTEQYFYDASNCLTSLRHQYEDSKYPGWTRKFSYETEQGQRVSNRLITTSVGNLTENYTYDANGNMKSMPHLSKIGWDCVNQMRTSSQQIVNEGTPETTWYVYDGDGRRVRKVTERHAAINEAPTKLSDVLVVQDFELFRKFAGDGTTVSTHYETLHITGAGNVIAIVEDWSIGGDDSFRLTRYQLQDHLKSISMELDEDARRLSYEEFMPFGSTSHHSPLSKAPKRFRWAGKERDTENGLYYFGRRYYIPWLSRWLSPDPIGIEDGLNVFEYVGSNPIRYLDRLGTCKQPTTTKRTSTAMAATSQTSIAQSRPKRTKTIPQDNAMQEVARADNAVPDNRISTAILKEFGTTDDNRSKSRDGFEGIEFALKGLCGCTGLFVISEQAVYIGHYFESLAFQGSASSGDFKYNFTDMITAKKSRNSRTQVSLEANKALFANADAYLIKPHADYNDNTSTYKKYHNKMKATVKSILDPTGLTIHEHTYQAVDGESSSHDTQAIGSAYFKYEDNSGAKSTLLRLEKTQIHENRFT